MNQMINVLGVVITSSKRGQTSPRNVAVKGGASSITLPVLISTVLVFSCGVLVAGPKSITSLMDSWFPDAASDFQFNDFALSGCVPHFGHWRPVIACTFTSFRFPVHLTSNDFALSKVPIFFLAAESADLLSSISVHGDEERS